jgi:peroxiredoxin family protein
MLDATQPLAPEGKDLDARIAREVERQLGALRQELADLRERTPENRVTLVVFSGDLDKVLASFVIGTGAAAMGLEVSMFFTFWGLSALKKRSARRHRRDLYERMFAAMTPSGTQAMGVSKLNFGGMGAVMLRRMMKRNQIASLEELMELGREMGIRTIACTMSMDVLGVTAEDLVEGIEYGGVGAYLGDAARSRVTLFI